MKQIIFVCIMMLSLVGCVSKSDTEVMQENKIQSRCCSTSYTVSEPVKVIYKNTTYHKIYVPKTYITTDYEERPYRNCNIKNYCE